MSFDNLASLVLSAAILEDVIDETRTAHFRMIYAFKNFLGNLEGSGTREASLYGNLF
jgi:hypothetical protein